MTRKITAKLLYLYMFTHPGKKLNFMGNELAQIFEWDEKKELDWDALKKPVHAEFQEYCRRLNKVYTENSALWQTDYDQSSFRWIEKGEDGKAVLAFVRISEGQNLLTVMNFSGEDAYFYQKPSGDASLVFDTYDRKTAEYSEGKVHLSPFEGLLFEWRQ